MAAPKKKAETAPVPRGFLKAFEKKRQEQKDFLEVAIGVEKTIYVGDPAIDWAQGGFARGGMNLFYGPSKSGKTTKALKLAGIEQKRLFEFTGVWHYVVVYDSEYASDMNDPKTITRLSKLGINTDYCIIISSNEVNELFADIGKLEGDLQATRKILIENNGADKPKKLKDLVDADKKNELLLIAAIVVDSWGGIQSETAKDKLTAGNISGAANAFGGNAKTINPILQTLLRCFAKYGITGFFVQHCIENMDKDPRTGAYRGPKWILLGGQKLRFLSHAITFMEGVDTLDSFVNRNGDLVKEAGGIAVGKKIRVRCEKSRKQVEGRKAETWINFETGEFIRRSVSLFNLASGLGVINHPIVPDIDKKGKPVLNDDGTSKMKQLGNAYWGITGLDKTWYGQEKFQAEIETDSTLFESIWQKCLDANSSDAVGVAMGSEEGVGGGDSDEEEAMKAMAEEAIA